MAFGQTCSNVAEKPYRWTHLSIQTRECTTLEDAFYP